MQDIIHDALCSSRRERAADARRASPNALHNIPSLILTAPLPLYLFAFSHTAPQQLLFDVARRHCRYRRPRHVRIRLPSLVVSRCSHQHGAAAFEQSSRRPCLPSALAELNCKPPAARRRQSAACTPKTAAYEVCLLLSPLARTFVVRDASPRSCWSVSTCTASPAPHICRCS